MRRKWRSLGFAVLIVVPLQLTACVSSSGGMGMGVSYPAPSGGASWGSTPWTGGPYSPGR